MGRHGGVVFVTLGTAVWVGVCVALGTGVSVTVCVGVLVGVIVERGVLVTVLCD